MKGGNCDGSGMRVPRWVDEAWPAAQSEGGVDPQRLGDLGGRITHGGIFRRYWRSITGTLALIIGSAGLWVVQPYLLGVAIDDLTNQQWRGMAWLGGLQVAALLVGGAGRFYDTRVYSRIYREIGAEAISASQAAGLDVTRVAARANMLREVVSFFEFRVSGLIRAVIDLVGSLTLLAILSTSVFYASFAAMAAIGAASLLFGGVLFRINRAYNDQLEQEIDVFRARARARTDEHLAALASWQVKRSDVQVAIFGLTSLVLTAVVFFALYDTVAVQGAAIGLVFSIVSYVRRFQIATFQFPAAYQQLIRTLEITRRINEAWRAPASDELRASAAVHAEIDVATARYIAETREAWLTGPRWI